jgi:competence protein ComEC
MVWGLAAALAAGVWYRFHVFWLIAAAPAVCSLLRPSSRVRYLLGFASAGLLFLYGFFTASLQNSDLAAVQSTLERGYGTSAVRLIGWVAGFPQTGPSGVRFRLRTTLAGRTVDVIAYTAVPGLGYGDSLQFDCRTLKRRGSDSDSLADRNTLLAQRACASVRAVPKSLRWLPGHNGGFLNRRLFWPVHDLLRRRITRLLGARSGIPLALLLGEKGYLDRAVKQTFIDLGISHLLALSGMHLGLVAGAILLIFSRLGVRSHLALWLILSLYVGVVGEVVSLLRAYVMASVLIAARAMQRPLDPLTALGDAVLLILLWLPLTIHSVGFQLSLVATLAVLLCVGRFSMLPNARWYNRLWVYSKSTVLVGIFVQLFMSPLLILHFHQLSAVSPVATLIFFPFVTVVLFLSFVCSIAGAVSPGAGFLLSPVLEAVDGLFRHCLLTADGLSPRLVRLPQMDLLLTWIGIYLIWRFGRRRRLLLAGVLMLGLAFLRPLNFVHKFLMQ